MKKKFKATHSCRTPWGELEAGDEIELTEEAGASLVGLVEPAETFTAIGRPERRRENPREKLQSGGETKTNAR